MAKKASSSSSKRQEYSKYNKKMRKKLTTILLTLSLFLHKSAQGTTGYCSAGAISKAKVFSKTVIGTGADELPVDCPDGALKFSTHVWMKPYTLLDASSKQQILLKISGLKVFLVYDSGAGKTYLRVELNGNANVAQIEVPGNSIWYLAYVGLFDNRNVQVTLIYNDGANQVDKASGSVSAGKHLIIILFGFFNFFLKFSIFSNF